MGPQILSAGLITRAQSTADEVETATKWWNDYPTSRYIDLARPEITFQNYMSNVWSKSKELARSASYTNLTYVKEATHDFPIRRSTSASLLAPSLSVPEYCRRVERIIDTIPVYQPKICNWYNTYSKARWIDTHESITRPLRVQSFEPMPYSSYVPYYTFQTKRIFFNERLEPLKSYIAGSRKYLDQYVSARLKADDFAQQYAHTAYDWRYPRIRALNRHFICDESVYIPHVSRTPHSYNDARALRRLYHMTGRFHFA
ncbi:unnamed protein product [Litomosoides sigmodontis]|uniref:Uncharacterized protein n=1 Tax=Litomosoides sigmodontis TaxID=42156 RepID=A0A3P7K5G2_LITSI|nr:unnamed protein product [Litomosoides sigmodontis]